MATPRLNLLVLKTLQLERLQAFYSALGIVFVEERHGNGPLHYSGTIGDLVLELYPLPASAALADLDATTRLGFAVPDLDAAVRLLETVGGKIIREARVTEWG